MNRPLKRFGSTKYSSPMHKSFLSMGNMISAISGISRTFCAESSKSPIEATRLSSDMAERRSSGGEEGERHPER